eukprot:gene12778-14993_t
MDTPPVVAQDEQQQQQQLNVYSTIDLSPVDGSKEMIDGVLKTSIHIPSTRTDRKLLLIVLVDKSSSIRAAWSQIQSTLLSLFTITFNNPQDIILEIIIFNDTAFRLNWTKDTYKTLIMGERPNGRTCFAATFDLCGDILKQYFKKGTVFKSDESYDPKTDVAIVMLTDGSHTTTRDHKKAFQVLNALCKSITCASSTVHSMGFTEGSRFSDLDGIRRTLGTRPGIYQYAEPGDGPHALTAKLRFIFDVILTTSDTINATISFPADTAKFTDTNSNSMDLVLSLDTAGDVDLSLAISVPRHLAVASVPIGIKFSVEKSNLINNQEITPITKIEPEFIIMTQLIAIESQLKSLFARMKTHGDANPPTESDKTKYCAEIVALQTALARVDNATLFSFPKQQRADLTDLKVKCLTQSSQMIEIVNAWVKSTWTAQSRARMADITYQFMFKDAGRQRRATFKVAKNAAALVADATRFKALEADLSELDDDVEAGPTKDALDASKQLFSCTLSLCNWVELLEDKDVIGFGMSVQRPETVIDDPTQIRVIDYSTTFLGKSSIEDAIALSVASVGQDKTTGGYEVGRDKISAAIKGRGREPINSWMPLYLHAEHWKPLELQLKSIIAYFVTLDPMAFSYDQVNALFLVVGSMISKDIGERQMQVVIQFIRTLRAIALHFKFLANIKKQLVTLITRPLYAISEQPKNLLVIIGYTLILTDEEIQEIFGSNNEWIKFWESVLESAIRRSCFGFFKDKEASYVDDFCSDILYGNLVADDSNQSPLPTMDDDEIFNDISNHPSKDITTEKIGEYLDVKEYPVIPNDPHRVDPLSIKNKRFDSLVKLSTLMESRGYPTVHALQSCLQFVHSWRKVLNGTYRTAAEPSNTVYNAFDVIDAKFGVAPLEWIDYIKAGCKPTATLSFGHYMATIQQLYGNEMNHYILVNRLRAMACQGAQYRTNKVANSIADTSYTNTTEDANRCLEAVAAGIELRRADILMRIEASLRFSERISSGLKSTDMDAFCQSIPIFSEPKFYEFIRVWQKRNLPMEVPFARQKLICILANVRVSLDSLGKTYAKKIRPTTWVPGRKNNSRFFTSWGRDEFISIELEAYHFKYLLELTDSTHSNDNNDDDL